MKAEINNENKAKLFALYWGQLIGIDQEKGGKPCYVLTGNNIQYAEVIELKPLSLISDEDMKGVANLVGMDDELDPDWNDNLQELIEHLQGLDAFLILGDYFRSKGYALPWLGLSVEEMIEAGWIKLTES